MSRPGREGFGIRWRIVALVTGATFATALGLGIVATNWTTKTALARAHASLEHRAAVLIPLLESAYAELGDDTRVIASTPPILGIARSSANAGIDPLDGSSWQLWRTRLETIFTSFLARRPHYVQIRYISHAEDAREIVRVDATGLGPDRTIRVTPIERLQSKIGEPYIQDNLECPAGELHFSEVTRNRDHGQVQDLLVIRSVLPIELDGEPFGFVVINADAQLMLRDKVERVALEECRAALTVNRAVRLVFDPVSGWSKPDRSQQHQLLVRAAAHPDAPTVEDEADRYRIARRRSRVGAPDGHELGITVLAPEQQLLASANSLRRQSIAFGLLFVFLSTLVAAYGAHMVTAPLNRMRNQLLGYRDGHDLDLPVNRGDEVGQLARAFDDLARALNASRSEAEAARDTANRANVAKSAFLANMSHEIRTPLNAVIGLSNLVLKSRLDDQQRDYLQTVASSGESLLDVLNGILDFSKIEAGKLEFEEREFQPHHLAGDTLKALAVRAHERGLELVYRIAPDVPRVLVGDPARIRQVLVNLVGNAIKFTESGEVNINVHMGEGRTEEDTVLLSVSVTDTGIGIAADKLDTVFREFEQADVSSTRKYGGTGLGLPITRRLVEGMGGELVVRSELGRGSVFTFTIPCHVSSTGERQPWQDAVAELAGRPIVVVDDHEPNRIVLTEMLESHGVQVRAFANASETLEYVDSEAEHIDLILSDVQMSGMTGYDMARALRDRGHSIPVVLLTSTIKTDGRLSRAPNVKSLLTKPVREADLVEACVTALDLRDPVEAASPEVKAPSSSRHLRILLAEDSVPNQKLACALLTGAGHHVSIADNGAAAVEAFDLAVENDDPIDLILMDLQMPEMDGITATKTIRGRGDERGLNTPIVAMTAHALVETARECREAGMTGYVPKPIDPKRLEEVLDSIQPTSDPAEPESESPPQRPCHVPWQDLADLVGGKVEVLDEIVNEYRREMRENTSAITAGIAGDDLVSVGRAAHRLKSALAFFRANHDAEIAEAIDKAARAGDVEKVKHLVANLLPCVGCVLDQIAGRVNTTVAPD